MVKPQIQEAVLVRKYTSDKNKNIIIEVLKIDDLSPMVSMLEFAIPLLEPANHTIPSSVNQVLVYRNKPIMWFLKPTK